MAEHPKFMSGYVGTFSGKQIVLETIGPADIDIIDIAVGLAQQCRYAGQVWPFYSVAEHSILVSQLVPNSPGNMPALRALMHDAPEYIINDLVRPVKRKVSGYEEIEDRVMDAIDRRFELNYAKSDWRVIKQYDDLITIVERRKLMPRLDPTAYGRGVRNHDVPNVHFKCMSPPEAALQFLSRFYYLTDSKPTIQQQELIEIILRKTI